MWTWTFFTKGFFPQKVESHQPASTLCKFRTHSKKTHLTFCFWSNFGQFSCFRPAIRQTTVIRHKFLMSLFLCFSLAYKTDAEDHAESPSTPKVSFGGGLHQRNTKPHQRCGCHMEQTKRLRKRPTIPIPETIKQLQKNSGKYIPK